ILIDEGRDRPLAMDAGESRHVAGGRLVRPRVAEPAPVVALATRVGDVALPADRPVPLPWRERRLVGLGQIARQDVHVRSHVRVRVEDPETVSRHGTLLGSGLNGVALELDYSHGRYFLSISSEK